MSVLTPDFLQPFISREKNRKEILLIEYDGFIKNKSEGLILTMLKNKEKWIEKYPRVDLFDGMDRASLYDNTALFQPILFLRYLSCNNITDEVLVHDLIELEKDIDIDDQNLTIFEYALYQILANDTVDQCYIIKPTPFQTNEMQYLKNRYYNAHAHITLISDDLLTTIQKYNPSTIFLRDTQLLLGTIAEKYSELNLQDKMFVLGNTCENVYLEDNSDTFSYLFAEEINKLNSMKIFGITRMYSFQVEDIDDSTQDEDLLN